MIVLTGIQEFINKKQLAIAGVSRNKVKFGNAVYNELKNKMLQYRTYNVD